MPARKKTLLIRNAKQLRALRTPIRQEIVRTLSREGACTVRELAGELGREPAALYYHVHALVGAGIAKEKGKREVGTRSESVYSLVAPRIVIDRRERSKAFLAALGDLQRATLRTAERELAGNLTTRGNKAPDDCTSLLRLTTRLRPRDAAQVAEMLHKVAEFMTEKDDSEAGEPYSLTAAFTRVAE
jgi:DNA-binding transcriptional ArsR family regulator